jgi:hypothetical protein
MQLASKMLLLAVALIIVLMMGRVSVAAPVNAQARNLIAERFIDVFYSFDAEDLRHTLAAAETSIPAIVYYQGWAQGGNYKIVNRMPCLAKSPVVISCSVTVKDDLMGALGIVFDVTDTFSLTIARGNIISVETSSNDLEVFRSAQDWVRMHHPELLREPCRDFFNGGPTPGKCVQAMVEGFARFAASEDFPARYR